MAAVHQGESCPFCGYQHPVRCDMPNGAPGVACSECGAGPIPVFIWDRRPAKRLHSTPHAAQSNLVQLFPKDSALSSPMDELVEVDRLLEKIAREIPLGDQLFGDGNVRISRKLLMRWIDDALTRTYRAQQILRGLRVTKS